MLARIDQALRAGATPEHAPPGAAAATRDRDDGPTDDGGTAAGGLLARFVDEARAVGTVVHTAPDTGGAGEALARIVARAPAACRVVVWRSALVAAVVEAARARAPTLATHGADDAGTELARADVGVTEVDALVAASGTLVLGSSGVRRRAVSLLPPVHVAIATHDVLVADLAAGLARVAAGGAGGACTTLITGPSRTADIEKKLVVGVHGPCELHVIVVGDGPAGA
jgi:L-lactate utilization protein LutC